MYHTERLNSITHLIGALAALVGLVVLLIHASAQQDVWKIVSFSIYGTTLVLLFTCSTLYHSFRGRLKTVFQKLDHIAIYLLIAGTYTPITLVSLRGPWGWSIFSIAWSLAIVGVVVDIALKDGNRILPVILYLAMGWLSLVAIGPLLDALTWSGFLWLLIGGILYTVGVVFYLIDERMKHAHGIWHIFVIGGSSFHYLAVWYTL